ncbi:hypothetical protein Vi05172_g8524 [Venturia inaequalis]|nr:hypothetical protein Vi05172_g8524 [Venturia inaequalis]
MTPISKPIATGSISSKTIASLQKELHTTKTELETVKTGLETSTKTDTKAIVTDGRRLVRLAVEYACDQTDNNANVSTFPCILRHRRPRSHVQGRNEGDAERYRRIHQHGRWQTRKVLQGNGGNGDVSSYMLTPECLCDRQ